MSPFTDFPKMLGTIMQDALAAVPAPLRAVLEGAMRGESVFDTAKNLADVATEGATAGVDTMMNFFDRDAERKEPYQLNLSMNMDGRELDKKVVNVVGGIARDATR